MEFKDLGLFNGRTGSAKFQEAYSQLTCKYLPEQAARDRLPLHNYIGVAIDGTHYAFIFFEENGAHRHTALLPIDPSSLYPLLEAIERDARRPFTAENLIEDFGPGSAIAKDLAKGLWDHLAISLTDLRGSRKVQMLFKEWKKLFAQATSLGRVGKTRIDDYLLSIGLTRPLDYTRALFVLHTYNALLFKLIAADLVTAIRYKEYSGFASYASGSPTSALRDLLNSQIEHAEVFVSNNIENFIEGTFFSWYLERPPAGLLQAIRKMLARLGLYIFPTARHAHVQDVVKAVYQNLIPEALRKNIGEFYTPEWLVEFVLDEAKYKNASAVQKKLLDPCCGSGNFLIHAIARCKEAAGEAGQSSDQTLRLILQNVVGFDLNPLAVIAARLNYLLAIADLLPEAGRIEIPVYMADAVYAPIRSEEQGVPIRSYKIGTVLGDIELSLPEALVQRRQDFGRILSIMERDIEARDSGDNFMIHLRQNPDMQGLLSQNPDWLTPLERMFARVARMERKNWNRIWCRIVRNYFASVAVGVVDVVAGNPPWVRWSELPDYYRIRIKPTCSQYGIFSRTPFFGGNELDISGMISYTVTDKWLGSGGVLAFIITQIHFQAPSSEGFRSFRLPDNTPLGVRIVHDFTKVKPFRGLANKPAVFTWVRNIDTTYPVPYKEWSKVGDSAVAENYSLRQVKTLIHATDKVAIAIPPDKRWSIVLPKHKNLVEKLQGGSIHWKGRKGITTDLNGAYFVRIVAAGSSPGLVKIRTRPEDGEKPVPPIDRDVDGKHVFPLLKGAGQIGPFRYVSSNLVAIVPNRRITSIGSETSFRRSSPASYRYFHRVNQACDEEGVPLLEARSTWNTRMKPNGAPFYAVYNVGAYTFAPFKVVWAEMGGSIAAAVVSTEKLAHGLGTKPVVPDHKIYFVPTQHENDAHFLCAMLNSEPVRIFVDSFTVKIQVGTLFRVLKLPAFNGKDAHHRRLAELSKLAHDTGVAQQAKIDTEAWALVNRM
jgi:hypothetical protein